MRDALANWLCSHGWVWFLAEKGFLPDRVRHLCLARAFDIPVTWAHLVGRVDINDVSAGGYMAEREETRRG